MGLMRMDPWEVVLDLGGQGRPLNGGHMRANPNYEKKSALERAEERGPLAEEATHTKSLRKGRRLGRVRVEY